MFDMMFNGSPPYAYSEENLYNSQFSPSTIHCKNTGLSRFFSKYLFQKAISLFEWKIPEHWSRDYMLYVLYGWGYFAVINTDKFGVIPQGCGLRGYNVFYQPTNAIIANPLIRKTLEPTIGRDCTIVKLQPNYQGIMDLVTYYADMLAVASEAVAVNMLNSKIAYTFFADNEAAAASYKKMFDKLASGEPATVINKKLINDDGSKNWDLFNRDLKANYLVSDILEDMRKIEAMFDTDVGIPNANINKKERMITDEVNSNNIETTCKADLWLESLKKSVKETNDMFGTDISVNWRYDPSGEVEADDSVNNDNNRSVRV